MAFKRPQQKKEQLTISLPSLFGSHTSMVVASTDAKTGRVLLKDEKGEYETTRDRLDTGLADPRRYDSSRLTETPNVKVVVSK